MISKSSGVLVLFMFLVVISVASSYYKFFVLRDYPIQAQIECDPTTEACFVYHCDATVEECTGDPVADTSYYKLIERHANNIPLCNPANEGCVPLECVEGEADCSITLCDASLEDGSECSDPEEYNALNAPIEVVEPEAVPMDTTEPELEMESNTGE